MENITVAGVSMIVERRQTVDEVAAELPNLGRHLKEAGVTHYLIARRPRGQKLSMIHQSGPAERPAYRVVATV